jgi:hypothetical protein
MLTLADVKLVLDDLLDKRKPALEKSQYGKLAEPELAELKAAIDALPRALTTASPLSEELAEADDDHDEAGRVIFYATEVVLHDKDASAEAVAAAKHVRAQLVPELDELRAPLADEVSRAKERRPLLSDKSFKAELKLLPLTGGRSVFDAATTMLDAADRISTLLSNRSDVAKPDRSAATTLRPKVIGVLNDLRRNLTKERARNKRLPTDIDSQIFSYFDLLNQRRPAKKAAAPPATPPQASPPSTPPAMTPPASTLPDPKTP